MKRGHVLTIAAIGAALLVLLVSGTGSAKTLPKSPVPKPPPAPPVPPPSTPAKTPPPPPKSSQPSSPDDSTESDSPDAPEGAVPNSQGTFDIVHGASGTTYSTYRYPRADGQPGAVILVLPWVDKNPGEIVYTVDGNGTVQDILKSTATPDVLSTFGTDMGMP